MEDKLYKKLEDELKEFKAEMKDYLIYNKELSKFELKTLLKREDILEECYDDWLSCDGNLREALEFSVDDTIDIIRDNEVKKERNKDAR